VHGDVVRVDAHPRGGILVTLADGAAVVDRGNRLAVRGRLTDVSAAALAEQARRHGWARVEVTGDAAQRDRIAAALSLRGIQATNCLPSRAALRAAVRAAERQEIAPAPAPTPEAGAPPQQVPQARPVAPRPTRRSQTAAEPAPSAQATGHALVPSWARQGPRKPGRGEDAKK
jgi:hypothetical protein